MKNSAALPLTWNALRFLIVANWLFGAGILVLLIFSVVKEVWTFTALGVPPSPDTRSLMQGMRAIAVLGLVAIPCNHSILQRLRWMVESVRNGDPFVAANADRLRAIAWTLLGLQLLGLVIAAIGKAVSTPAHPLHLAAGFSPGGWLAVFLIFVLARVFAQGTAMRDDLAGTV